MDHIETFNSPDKNNFIFKPENLIGCLTTTNQVQIETRFKIKGRVPRYYSKSQICLLDYIYSDNFRKLKPEFYRGCTLEYCDTIKVGTYLMMLHLMRTPYNELLRFLKIKLIKNNNFSSNLFSFQ